MLRNRISGALRRRRRLIAIPAAALVGGALVALGAAQEGSGTPDATKVNGPKGTTADEPRSDVSKSPADTSGHIDGYLAGGRWREGSKLVDVPGHFKTSGERVAFHSADGKTRFACLENLNSERVARIVAESPPDSLQWIVQGTLTEFRSENYLLLTQAVIRNRTVRGPRPTPDRSLRAPDTKGTQAPP